MSEVCAILSCKRSSCALCHCCQQNICLPHLKEHQDLLISELNPLVDQINELGDQLKAVNIKNKIIDARQKLEEWRVDCHQTIDHFVNQKCRELDHHLNEKIDKQREEVSRIQSKAAELIHEQQATRRDLDLLRSTITNLEREVTKIGQTSLNIRCQSLKINDNWIQIRELSGHRIDLSQLPPVYKTIEDFEESAVSMASNDHLLLMHRKPNLCLIDRTLKIVHKSLWDNGMIYDMSWSSVLDRFIIIGGDNVFFVDPSKMSIEKASEIPKKKWISCTCSDASLYLSVDHSERSFISEYSLSPSIQLAKPWKPSDTCQKDERISRMKYNNNALALVILNLFNKAVHIELRTAKTFERLWSLRLDVINTEEKRFSCCVINEDEWLVPDHVKRRLIHVTGDGKMKAICVYGSVPWYLCMFGFDILAITDDRGLNFHKL